MSLEKKLLATVLACVVIAITILTVLIVRRESMLLKEEHRNHAEAIATALQRALKDNMLSGRPEETGRLVRELSGVTGITRLTVMRPDGTVVFGKPGNGPELDQSFRTRLSEGRDIFIVDDGAHYFVKPLMNETACRSCHRDEGSIRGMVLVGMSTVDITGVIKDLAMRMGLFGFLTASGLAGVLTALGRKKLLAPLQGLTAATRQIMHGNFVLHNPRGTRCHEVLGCTKEACPSFGNDAIPCWLQSGTLCDGAPTGQFAVKFGNCMRCKVYKQSRGDEIVQLQDNFNMMSLALQGHEEGMADRMDQISSLNQELTKSNTKLTTLLDASRLTTSTLELEMTLSTSLKIILDVTNLKAGLILLLEEDIAKRCHEFFDCDAYNCPAYKADVNCWRLSGTMCHGDASTCPNSLAAEECWHTFRTHTHYSAALTYDEKIRTCSHCEFFANVILIPKMTAGYTNGHLGQRLKIDSGTLHKALIKGQTLVNYSRENPFKIPMETITEIAMPLKVKEQITGVLYLASDEALHYSEDEIAFFQFLSEVISSGIFNSRLYEDMETSYFQTVMSLSNAIEAKDPYTRGHSERVADLGIRAAEALNLSRQEKEHLRFASILHDVGKIGISRELLRKSCALDECEEAEVRSHPDRGVQILEPVYFLKAVLPAIRHHHERFDGSGYPLRLRGKEIPFKARIIAVADAWDAMRSDRPYRAALTVPQAKEELQRHAGSQFDPEVVDCFVKMIPDV